MIFSRRVLIGSLGATASLPLFGSMTAWAQPQQNSLLPVNTPKIDHLDVIVPNVEASARFYMSVFNTTLHAQPFQGGFRYFILFGDLPDNRQVGYLAIGDSRGRGTYIGHFCTSVFNYRRDSMAISAALAEAVDKAGLGKLSGGGGIGGIFSDPDGIEIQFLPAPDTLVRRPYRPISSSHARDWSHPRVWTTCCCTWPIWKRALASIGFSTARKRRTRRVRNASGFRLVTLGSGWSRHDPARSHTSITSASKSRRSTAAP
jgi:catechol 2,3-dioxygenase-like lactoylglutathione lyase family enzyme